MYADAAGGNLPGRYGVSVLYMVLRCCERLAFLDPVTLCGLPEPAFETVMAYERLRWAEEAGAG